MSDTRELDPDWQELSREILRQVELTPSDIVLANRPLVWQRVANPDVLLERAVTDDGRAEELDPFWAATWRAALGLDVFLQRLDLKGQNVLELGCGSGQAGCAAAMQGARVTMTDSVRLALQVAELNSWHVREAIEFRQLLWKEQCLDTEFPLIIGSDLVYDPGLFSALEVCAREHLAPTGKLYLSEPHRHSGDKFAGWIRRAQWQVEEHDVDLGDERVPIRIFECRL